MSASARRRARANFQTTALLSRSSERADLEMEYLPAGWCRAEFFNFLKAPHVRTPASVARRTTSSATRASGCSESASISRPTDSAPPSASVNARQPHPHVTRSSASAPTSPPPLSSSAPQHGAAYLRTASPSFGEDRPPRPSPPGLSKQGATTHTSTPESYRRLPAPPPSLPPRVLPPAVPVSFMLACVLPTSLSPPFSIHPSVLHPSIPSFPPSRPTHVPHSQSTATSTVQPAGRPSRPSCPPSPLNMSHSVPIRSTPNARTTAHAPGPLPPHPRHQASASTLIRIALKSPLARVWGAAYARSTLGAPPTFGPPPFPPRVGATIVRVCSALRRPPGAARRLLRHIRARARAAAVGSESDAGTPVDAWAPSDTRHAMKRVRRTRHATCLASHSPAYVLSLIRCSPWYRYPPADSDASVASDPTAQRPAKSAGGEPRAVPPPPLPPSASAHADKRPRRRRRRCPRELVNAWVRLCI